MRLALIRERPTFCLFIKSYLVGWQKAGKSSWYFVGTGRMSRWLRNLSDRAQKCQKCQKCQKGQRVWQWSGWIQPACALGGALLGNCAQQKSLMVIEMKKLFRCA
jgi:hypothetical protein